MAKSRQIFSKWALLGTAAGISLASTSYAAQDDTTADVGEIIVTAQKRAERLIDTPQSISVLSAETLAKGDAKQFRDFADKIPGLSFQSSGAGESQVVLRGVTTGFDNTPTVAIYVDDVPYGSSGGTAKASVHALDLGLFDVDRIEVLRGPQGTLYGASSIGGIIKYVTKAPDPARFGGEVRAGIADTKNGQISYNGAAAVNLPIAEDKAAVRASGYYNRDGGYIDNVARGEKEVNRSRVYGGRLDLLLKPTEDLSVRIVGIAQNIRRGGLATADYTLAGDPIFGPLEQSRVIAEPFRQRFRLVSGTIGYDFDFATLTSVSSYQRSKTAFTYDSTPTLGGLIALFGYTGPFAGVGYANAQDVKKFVQEVRLASPTGSRLEWLIGGFYTHEKVRKFDDLSAVDADAVPVFPLLTQTTPSRYEEIAGFGNLTYHLSDKLDLSGGVRYASNRQALPPITSSGPIASPPAATSRAKDNVITYLANARYHFGRNAIAYLRYATGYRPGQPLAAGIIDPISGQPLPNQTKADTVKSYEAGFKGETSDRSFGGEISVYRVDWSNIPVLGKSASGLNFTTNGGKARITGGELTLTARPTQGLVFTGVFAYQRARLINDVNVVGGLAGDPLPNVPKYTAALDADYRISDVGLKPRIGATLRFVDARPGSFPNDPSFAPYRFPSYETVDLRAGIVLADIDIQLYARNILNEHPQLLDATAISVVTGPVHVATLQPRTIGLSVSRRF